MSTQIERLAIELLGLPTSSCALLIKQLLASLDDSDVPEVSKEWIELAERRADELISGKVQGIPAEEVFRKLRQNFG